jgi:formamidopyrimidine-DNA glycosylase
VPELPEVETVRRSLEPRVTGRRIVTAEFRSVRVLRGGDPDHMAAALAGARIVSLERRGKFLLFRLDGGSLLMIHLGMTGKLLMDALPGRHTHAILTLDRGTLVYDDPRQFGCLELHPDVPARVARLGPEPLEISPEDFIAALARRKRQIKALLLDQTFLRGLGNIYADEALFRAGIHPLALASRLRKPRALRLYRAIVEVLTEAIQAGGSSISDYVDGDGRPGFFQFSHKVYQRTGEPCTVCGSPIRRILVGQRGTHFCGRCQRR